MEVELARAEDQIARRGRRLARLDAVATNQLLLEWHRRPGYRDVGFTAFEDADWHDAILMEKALPTPPWDPATSHQ